MIVGTVPIAGPLAPTAVTDVYGTHFSTYGIGGFREVADITARDAVSDERRVAYMMVVVQSDGTYWELKPGPWTHTSSDWNQLQLGAAGTLAGDVTGPIGANTVIRIQGYAVSAAAPTGGDSLVWDANANQYVPAKNIRYAASGAAAAAAAPYILGTYVIVSPGSPTSEAGTYQVTSGTGSSFPADYTKIADATDTAAEVGLVDAAGNYVATDLEAAATEVARGEQGHHSSALSYPAQTILDTVPVDSFGDVLWELVIHNATSGLRERWTVSAGHNGLAASDATLFDYNVHGRGPDNGNLVAVDLFGTGVSQVMRLLVTAVASGWTATWRRIDSTVAAAS